MSREEIASNVGKNIGGDFPTVSVIMPCRNEKDSIQSCLDSILALASPPGGFEVIVADGMSDDGTRDILKHFQTKDRRIRVVNNFGRVVSTGLNTAIRSAQGKIIIRMDSHTQYAPDYIQQCVQVLAESNADNVGGPWIAKGSGRIGKAIAATFQSPFAFGGAKGHDPHYSGVVDTVYLGCWRREIFDRVGMFDEELVRNQDDEFNLRLSRLGGKIWQSPRIKSWYQPRNSLIALFAQYKQYGYWKVRVIQKHRIPASVRHVVPAGFVLSLLVLACASPWSVLASTAWWALVATYAFCILVASLVTAAGNGWTLLPLLPLVFACYQFGYAYGFCRGILDFVILRRGAAETYTRLTRQSEKTPQPDAETKL